MNREIKFRSKRLDNSKWIIGSETIIQDGDGIWLEDKDLDVVKVDPVTVGQYTGMKDRNGKEIYEDDILRIDGFNTEGEAEEWVVEVGQYGEVAYSTADSDYSLLAWIDNFVEYEVIGNIHDNPELMKTE